jgi:hypothetical protein
VAAQRPAQQQSGPVEIVSTVIRYRTAWLADSARFDACSVSAWTGGDGLGIANAERVLLGRADNDCVRGRVSTVAQLAGHVVVVDSVAITDSIARVRLTVRHGEYTHHETFILVPHVGSVSWGVRDVNLWGAMQSSRPRRPAR